MTLDERRHPDAERLAEYAEGTLDARTRAGVEAHLAGCADCRAVVAETSAFLDAEPAIEAMSASAVLPFRPRTWMTAVAAGLAVAAAVTVAIRVDRPGSLLGPRSDRPELQELVAAVANEPTRPVEGRLSGFPYLPPPSATRGLGDRSPSPDVRIAAATIEKRNAGDQSPATRGALGVAYLVLGDIDRSVDALEEAVQRDSANAPYQTDLSAAYLARARLQGSAGDWTKALAAAERAIALAPRQPEAYFNKAIALEGLRLKQQALDAWAADAAVESVPAWAAEARRRADALKEP